MRILSSSVLFLVATVLPFCLSAAALPGFDLADWPPDVIDRMKKEVPELQNTVQDDDSVNLIIKKLDQKMQFNGLRVVRQPKALRLIGEISAFVDKIEFFGLENLSEAEASVILNLNLKNALDEDTLKAAADRLTQHYREEGYRFAEIRFEIVSQSTIKKSIVFHIDVKNRTRLTDIKIEGPDPQTIQEIEAQMKILIFKPILRQDTINRLNTELRRQLSLHGYYLTPLTPPQTVFSADELSARVIYRVAKTNPYAIEILNAQQFSVAHLEEDVLKLETYASKDSNFGSDLIEKLKQFYVNEGYPHIDVSYYERKEGQKIIMTFNLDEGPYTRLNRLKISGQLSRDEKHYRERFFALGSEKLQARTFIKEDIEAAAKNLLIELQNEGFVNARLGRVQIGTDRENPQDGQVSIQLDEGPQLIIDSISFEGLVSQTPAKLQEIAQLNPGHELNLSRLEQSLQNLKNYYTSLGYIEYKLLNENKDLISYSEKNTRAQLRFKIQEGPRVQVESILLEGNESTHDKVILTEIDFKPGDVLTPAKIDESIARLQRTGHFSSIDLTTVEAGTNIAQRTVLVKVVERDPGVFTIGAGGTNENNGTIRGYTGVAYRNIGGWGRGLSARVEGNYNFADVRYLESKIILGGVEPYLFDTRARLRLNVTRSRTISDFSLRKVTELNLGVISIEQDFTSHITGIWDLLSVATYVDHGITPQDEIKNGYTYESQVIGSTGPTVDIDYRDNIFNPTKGSFSRFTFEYASNFLGNNNVDDFIRATAQSTWYFPLSKGGLVFAQSVGGGYVKDINDQGLGVPYDKKGFTLGGRTTIRGFGSTEFFPSTQESSSQFIGTTYKLTGAASYQLVKSEIRFPLVSKWDLMGALFYDGGQVLLDGFDFKNRWRDAAGLGIRYNTPIGPLNLEYGQKLNRQAGENDGAFYLSVGVF